MAEEDIVTGGAMDLKTALQEVLKTGLTHDGVTWNSLPKPSTSAKLIFVSLLPSVMKLYMSSWWRHQVNLIKVDDNKKLGG